MESETMEVDNQEGTTFDKNGEEQEKEKEDILTILVDLFWEPPQEQPNLTKEEPKAREEGETNHEKVTIKPNF